ncbi:hypothetical protein DV515_00009585 [Chloebia gouldiae]|uniref:Uncharacterized protein n=1 Tax=Chloebia gouldiae TaxID=44316 RepID=A0A3L8SBU8_CHLGU|nr:hypothetical protein DV515_00009585 [Chloebia gouldiae]
MAAPMAGQAGAVLRDLALRSARLRAEFPAGVRSCNKEFGGNIPVLVKGLERLEHAAKSQLAMNLGGVLIEHKPPKPVLKAHHSVSFTDEGLPYGVNVIKKYQSPTLLFW